MPKTEFTPALIRDLRNEFKEKSTSAAPLLARTEPEAKPAADVADISRPARARTSEPPPSEQAAPSPAAEAPKETPIPASRAQETETPHQADAMARLQMEEQDANQARTIYTQIMADRQKALARMFEIMQEARMQSWAVLQEIMVNRLKTAETANLNFCKYLLDIDK